jgi:phosphoacetylglucosamine mutase
MKSSDHNHLHILAPKASPKEVLRLLNKYSLSTEIEHYDYGTAGFRLDARHLPGLMVRVGIMASIRCLAVRQHVGVMVTASHNDESYNGIKLADPHGGMWGAESEQMAHQIANERNIGFLLRLIRTLLPLPSKHQQQQHEQTKGVNYFVHVGRDTRSHSPGLSELVVRTVVAMGVGVVHHGILTTPMLHHSVLHANSHHLPLYIPIRPNRQGYLDLLAYSYWSLMKTTTTTATTTTTSSSRPLVVDCACGVGYQAIQDLHKQLQRVSCGAARPLHARNAPGEGPLNVGCGSEVVQKNIQPPTWYGDDYSYDDDTGTGTGTATTTNTTTDTPYAASLDGDADRIVFFSNTSSSTSTSTDTGKQPHPSQPSHFCMMDGDKIAVLICEFFQNLLEELYALDSTLPKLTLGVVQTAYANGASTQYLQVRTCHVMSYHVISSIL